MKTKIALLLFLPVIIFILSSCKKEGEIKPGSEAVKIKLERLSPAANTIVKAGDYINFQFDLATPFKKALKKL